MAGFILGGQRIIDPLLRYRSLVPTWDMYQFGNYFRDAIPIWSRLKDEIKGEWTTIMIANGTYLGARVRYFVRICRILVRFAGLNKRGDCLTRLKKL